MFSIDLLHHYRQLCQQPLTVVDVETTGRLVEQCRVIELAVIHASLADGIIHSWTDLINPETTIPPEITQFTGISQDMTAAAAPASKIFPQYLNRLNRGVLVAHNLDFDLAFLQREFRRIGLEFQRSPQQRLCTVQLSRLMLPDLPSRSLPKLVNRFKFDVGRSHRAQADAIACWLLAKKLLTIVANEDDETILSMFAKEWIPPRIAAEILGCSQADARRQLEQTGVNFRISKRNSHKVPMYRRGEVEAIARLHQSSQQLSLF